MKIILFVIIGLLFSLKIIAQPTETDIRFDFQVKVDTVSFNKGISNLYLKMIEPNVILGYSIKQIKKSELVGDTMKTSIVIPIRNWEPDTLAFDIVNSITNYKMKVVISSLSYEYFYTFNLKEFFKAEGISTVLYFDMMEISDLLNESENDEIKWKLCDVKRDVNTSTISIRVNDFGLNLKDGFIRYSWDKIKNNRFDNRYHRYPVEGFFKLGAYNANTTFLEKQQDPHTKTKPKIVAQYEYYRTRQNKKNKLFGHNVIYTFYDDYSFTAQDSNPPPEVSLVLSNSTGIGVWEIIGNEIHLETPEHWIPFYDDIYLQMRTAPMLFSNIKYKIQGKKLIVGESYSLKWNKIGAKLRRKK